MGINRQEKRETKRIHKQLWCTRYSCMLLHFDQLLSASYLISRTINKRQRATTNGTRDTQNNRDATFLHLNHRWVHGYLFLVTILTRCHNKTWLFISCYNIDNIPQHNIKLLYFEKIHKCRINLISLIRCPKLNSMLYFGKIHKSRIHLSSLPHK